jgi:hypothetical protein
MSCAKSLELEMNDKDNFWEGYVPEPVKPAPMTKDEALDLALEIMYSQGDVGVDEWLAAEAAIKQALAAPVQEPVAWVCYGAPGKRDIDFEEADINDLPIGTQLYTTPPAALVQEPFCFFYVENGEEYFAPKGAYVPDNAQPLYTTPPAAQRQWVGLDVVEIMREWSSAKDSVVDFARAIEAKLKEKNT